MSAMAKRYAKGELAPRFAKTLEPAE